MDLNRSVAMVDVARFISERQEPCYIFPRNDPGVWLIANSDLTADKVSWVRVLHSSHVYLPLFRYKTAPDPSILFGFGLQLAARALIECHGNHIKAVQLALGRPAEDLRPDEEAFAVWCGLGVLISQ